MNDDRTPNLLPVIQWLEAGCDPKHAAAELRIYAERLAAAALSAAPAQEPVAWMRKGTQPHQEGKALTDERINELAAEYGDELDQAFIFNRLGRFSAVAFARAIERELRGAQEGKAGEWLPIESAPKDGSQVLLTNGKSVAQGWWEHQEPYIREKRDMEGNYIDQDEHDGYDGWLDCDGGKLPEPTHWQPLPPPPSATLSASSKGEQR